MKTNAIVRIILFSIAIFILLGILAVGLGASLFSFDRFRSETAQTPENMTSSFPVDPGQIQNIKIQWTAGSITIQPSEDTDTIQVMESEPEKERDRMDCRISGNTLTIQFRETRNSVFSFGTSIDAKDLVILVPAGWDCQNLEIEAASADVDIRDMTVNALELMAASSLCNLENCTVNELDVDAASGDLSFSGYLNTLEFDGASADCSLKLMQCPSHIDLDGMSGNLEITLPSDCGFTVDTEGLSNKFSTDFPTTTRDGAYVCGDGSCTMEIDALSGSVAIYDGGYACHSRNSDSGHHSHH